MCHLYRLRINTHVLTITMPCFIARHISMIDGLVTLPDSDSDSDSKPNGYIVLERTFSYCTELNSDSNPTVNYRNGIGIGLGVEIRLCECK